MFMYIYDICIIHTYSTPDNLSRNENTSFPPKVSMASFFQYSFLDIGLLNAIPSSPAVLSMPAVLLFHHSS